MTSNIELSKFILSLIFAGEPGNESERGIRQVRSLIDEVVEKKPEYGIDMVLATEPTDAVKSVLRNSAVKAIIKATELIGDETWKNRAKRDYWTTKRDHQLSRMILAQKELDAINLELLSIPLEIDHASD